MGSYSPKLKSPHSEEAHHMWSNNIYAQNTLDAFITPNTDQVIPSAIMNRQIVVYYQQIALIHSFLMIYKTYELDERLILKMCLNMNSPICVPK